jgi:multidrug transporter EmrE-like cation transporter
MWPQRFLGFSIGIVMYAILTYFFLNQGMTPKTWVSLTLAVMIIIIQVIFK